MKLSPIARRLVEDNWRLAWHVARKFTHTGIDLEDLRSEATIGLCRAAMRWDSARGVKFASYAYRVIFNQVLTFVECKRPPATAEFLEWVADDGEPSDFPDARELIDRVRDALPAKWFDVLMLRAQGFTLQETGDQIGLTREAARQIQVKALRAARKGCSFRINA